MRLRLTIRSKLSLGLLAATVLTVGIALGAVLHVLKNSSEQETNRRLAEAIRTVRLILTLQQTAALWRAEILAGQENVRDAIVAGDRAALIRIGRRTMQEHDLDFVLMTDEAGIVLARAHAPDQYGDDGSTVPTVRGALHGVKVATIRRAPTVVLGASGGAPVFEPVPPYRLLGVVVAGYALDDAFVKRLKETIGHDVSFSLDNARLYTTLPAAGPVDPAWLAASAAGGPSVVRIQIADQSYRAAYGALQGRDSNTPIGSIEVAESELPIEAIRFQTIKVTGVGVGVGALIILGAGLWFASRLTRPLALLARAAKAMGGGDLSQRVDVRSGDEVELVMDAFNQMAVDIQRREVERNRAEGALQESEERYRSLFENTRDAILLTVPDGRILAANPEACRIFGRTEEEICQVGRGGLVDTTDPRLPALLEERARTGKVRGELTFLRKDGTKFPGEISSAVFTDREGLSRTSMIIHDITERKRAEEALRESEERYRLLIDQSPYAIGVHQDGKVLFVNPSAVRLFGAESAGDLTGKPLSALVHPETWEAARKRIGRMLKGETGLYPTEDRYVRLDGSEVPVEVTAAPFTHGGRPAIQVIALDITERKRAEEALRQSEARYRSLFENMLNGFAYCKMLFTDNQPQDFVYLEVNRAFGELTGLKNVIAKKVTDVIPGIRESNRELFEIYGRVALTGMPEKFEARIERLGIWFSISVFSPQREYFVAVFDNITERKRAEEALKKSEALYHDLVETSQDLIWQCDTEGRYVYLNPAWETVFGYKVEEMLGRRFYDFQSPEMAARDLEGFARLLLDGSVSGYDAVHLGKAGNEIHLVFNAKLVTDEHGNVVGTRGTAYDITERVQTQRVLQEREELLSETGRMARVGGWIFDVETLEGTWTDEVARIHEVDPGQATNVEMGLSFFHGESREKIETAVRDAIELGRPYDLELELITAKGNHKWVRTIGHPQRSGGKTLKVGGSIQDITERKRAEEALRESEERLRLALQAAKQGLYDLNIQTGEAIVTPEYATMLGYDPATFVETNAKWIERLHPDDREPVAATYRAYIRGDLPEYRVEFCQRTQAGDYKWILSLGKVVERDAAGQPLRMLGTHTDITERKRAEAAVRESEEQFRAAFEQAAVGIAQVGPNGRWLRVNQKLCDIVGYTRNELLACSLQDITHPDDLETDLGYVRQLLAGEIQTYSMEKQYVRKDRSPVWINLTASLVRTPDGSPKYFISVAEDISERKKAEQALREKDYLLSESQRIAI